MADRLDQCNRCLSSVEILKGRHSARHFGIAPANHERNSQQNVMQIYESAVLRRGSFPCRPATVGVIVAALSWLKQAERRVDHVQAQDAGADAAPVGLDGSGASRRRHRLSGIAARLHTDHQELSRGGAVYRPIMSTMWCRTHC